MSASGRLYAAQLRAGHKRAHDRLRAALRRHGGSVRDAAADLATAAARRPKIEKST